MKTSESINELAKALAAAQAEIQNPGKNAENPHFKSKYADLSEVLNAARPALSKNGLSVLQSPTYCAETGVASVTTLLMHSSGQFIEDTASSPVNKRDAQGIGAVTTYLRRYALAGYAGCAQQDDDAQEDASAPKAATKPKAVKKAELPTYTAEEFAGKCADWAALITAGKHTPEQIVASAATKVALTKEQREIILNIKPVEVDHAS